MLISILISTIAGGDSIYPWMMCKVQVMYVYCSSKKAQYSSIIQGLVPYNHTILKGSYSSFMYLHKDQHSSFRVYSVEFIWSKSKDIWYTSTSVLYQVVCGDSFQYLSRRVLTYDLKLHIYLLLGYNSFIHLQVGANRLVQVHGGHTQKIDSCWCC